MNTKTAFFRFVVAGLLALAGAAGAIAQELDAALNESIVTVPKKGVFTIELETTLYKPEGDGPFPLVVINHGKANGDSRFQARYRPALAARYFLQRGYAVVVPMRQGFSKSTGSYIGGGCNVESNGRTQAEDVKAALDYFTAQPWVDKSRILIVGQSHGGWTSLATGTLNYPGVKGIVNFAGGLRQETCTSWESVLANAAGAYGKETTLPSLWFYGDNDSYFSPSTWKAMHDKYTASGGKARMVAFGTFGGDSHAMFGARSGARIWQPEVTAFLAEVGLPNQPVAALAKYGNSNAMAAPAKTSFAPLEDVAVIPYLKDTGRAGYKTFLDKPVPRAFAIAPNGAWAWSDGGEDPLKRALDRCNTNGKGACKLYAVDTDIVWTPE